MNDDNPKSLNQYWKTVRKTDMPKDYSSIREDLTVINLRMIEAAYKEFEDMFFGVFQTSPLITTITALKSGYFIDINENFHSILGYSREEILGHSMFELKIWDNPKE